MRLLYVASGHPLQEADDCLMWHRLGIDWTSTGYYALTNKPGDLPHIPRKQNCDLFCKLQEQDRWTNNDDMPETTCGKKNMAWTGQVVFNRFNFSREFIQENFDAVLVNFFAQTVRDNAAAFSGKKVMLKTYSMHPLRDENLIKEMRRSGLIVVRNSPKEHLRGKYGGHSAIIRGSVVKDEQEISGWTGELKKVCTFTSFMDVGHDEYQLRRNYYREIVSQVMPYESNLYGIGSTFVNHEDKVDILRKYRVNLVTGTPGSNNTYSFVEAWIMGQPIVVYGRDMWQSKTYEGDELIVHGETGFIGKTPTECAYYIKLLMEDENLARKIGQQGREAALKVYGRETLAEQWTQLFRTHGLI